MIETRHHGLDFRSCLLCQQRRLLARRNLLDDVHIENQHLRAVNAAFAARNNLAVLDIRELGVPEIPRAPYVPSPGA